MKGATLSTQRYCYNGFCFQGESGPGSASNISDDWPVFGEGNVSTYDCLKIGQLACDLMHFMFRGGVLVKVMSFKKPPQIVSQSSIRGRIQEQTSESPKLPFCFFKIKFKQHFMLSFTELTMAWRRYFNPLKEIFYIMTNPCTFR